MKIQPTRASFLLGIGFVVVAGALALAAPGPKNRFERCPRESCTIACDPATQGIVLCRDGRNGTTFQSTFACCCCVDNSKDRYYLGPK